MISLFDMFKIGIGPSSSHTVGPMVAANTFLIDLQTQFSLETVKRIQVDLYGSLAATGKGHATDTAIILGLLGHKANKIDTTKVADYLAPVLADHHMSLAGRHDINFNYDRDIIWHIQTNLPHHPNGLTLTAYSNTGETYQQTYYSIGGGFIANADEFESDSLASSSTPNSNTSSIINNNAELNTQAPNSAHLDVSQQPTQQHTQQPIDKIALSDDSLVPYPFYSAQQLLSICQQHNLSISEVMMANELALRSQQEIEQYLDEIWEVMQLCVTHGCNGDGILPGGLKVKRRAKALYQQLQLESQQTDNNNDSLMAMDWIDLYALAVNEENANGGRVVTAPTNGAAGIIPAVLHYYRDFFANFSQQGVREFLLTAAAIGTIIKQNASISGAEVGCQGEVGSACAMAAAGLAHVKGLSPAQCTNAAEIGIEHNLGLTCDPIGGLVQIPCIERNAMAAVKAINAARLAKRGDGVHFVSLDKAIATMKATGEDMMDKYKETAMGGLAIHVQKNNITLDEAIDPNRIAVVDVAVGYPQC
ncbi:L-serine ammonia-lyase [Psychrobacter sp. I-STPA10]|uniref:L-serine ammonia-lyase n=1 Tax=Psychrobacter sp. I-STPA10 TaxID=2585769 RepID=UPI001E634D88|nr:L-serine ammonia-lyase [Psychrobacter sp. I-STPA10]